MATVNFHWEEKGGTLYGKAVLSKRRPIRITITPEVRGKVLRVRVALFHARNKHGQIRTVMVLLGKVGMKALLMSLAQAWAEGEVGELFFKTEERV